MYYPVPNEGIVNILLNQCRSKLGTFRRGEEEWKFWNFTQQVGCCVSLLYALLSNWSFMGFVFCLNVIRVRCSLHAEVHSRNKVSGMPLSSIAISTNVLHAGCFKTYKL